MRIVRNLLLLIAAGVFAAARSFLSPDQVQDQTPRTEATGIRVWGASLKTWAFRIALLAVVFGILGFLGAASGVVPIKASSGHWAVTRWFLDFSKRRSVKTHTIGLKTPPLDHWRLVVKGAGHYELGCAPCHGSPKLQTPRVAQAMTPTPPFLPPRIDRWESAELFYIVKHGIKLTGMPAWPAQQRDDEVWAMVAFLRMLPRLDVEQYRRLVGEGELVTNATTTAEPFTSLLPPDKIPQAVTENCARCHGRDGLGLGAGAYPKLAGQRSDYLFASLQAYARRERHSGIMESVMAGLSAEEMRQIANYYGNFNSSPSPTSTGDSALISLGEGIALLGIPKQRVPACDACHGRTGSPRNPLYPNLSGQYADYLVLQLELFRDGNRGGTPYEHIMRSVATNLTSEQMQAVALYFASQAGAIKSESSRTPLPPTSEVVKKEPNFSRRLTRMTRIKKK